jgi:site-specific DNA-adenine methylase
LRYVGSKNKLSDDLIPIIQKYIDDNKVEKYLEPFVGGANVIDKIDCKLKIGCDIHPQLISLLQKAQEDFDFPEFITEEEYINVKSNKDNYPDWYLGLVGFCASFGAKYFGGYARDSKDDNSGKWSKGAIRNLNKQRENLKNIVFKNINFLDLKKDRLNKYVIYCDIPYKGTTKYHTEDFPYDDFYDWCREIRKNNIVLISEYNMPSDFKCIWQKEHKTLLDSGKNSNDADNVRIEKLYIA